MIFTVPIHEFNDCHEPGGTRAGGRWARRGVCGGTTPLTDPDRNRSVFNWQGKDPSVVAFSGAEAAAADNALSKREQPTDDAAKDAIVKTLAARLVDEPGLASLFAASGFPAPYSGGDKDAMARNVAVGLLDAWLLTSGDSDVRSVAVQLVANDQFGLGATYVGALRNDPAALGQASTFAKQHRQALGVFLQGMYEETQNWLEANHVGPDGYVTLYRGWTANTQTEPGLAGANLKKGVVADVSLQPLSSFTTQYATAKGFSTAGIGNTPLVMAVRVPVSRILGTGRTGFGSLFMREVVVLGGAYPGFMMDATSVSEASFLAQSKQGRP
jgi:hypothetical protein